MLIFTGLMHKVGPDHDIALQTCTHIHTNYLFDLEWASTDVLCWLYPHQMLPILQSWY